MGKRGGDKGSFKYKIFKELKSMSSSGVVNLVSISKKIGCSLAYVSMTIRFARESEYLEYNLDGEYVLGNKKIFAWDAFCTDLNERARINRQRGGGSSRKSKLGMKRIPQNIEISEENVLKVLHRVFDERQELKEKIGKLKEYILKQKREREELEKALEEID